MKKGDGKKMWFLSLIFLAFIALGLPDTGLGVAWNEMRFDFEMELSAAGFVSAMVVICSTISGFQSAKWIEKWGTGKLTVVSTMATSIAIFGYASAPNYLTLLLCCIPLGLGAGAVDSALNAYAAHHLENKHMNWLHACWGIGATFSPLLITFGVVQLHSWRAGWAIIASLLGLLSLVLYLNLGMWNTPYKVQVHQSVGTKIAKRPRFTIVLSVLTYVIYVAMEGGLGLWLSALLIESRGLSVGIAGVMVSSYFGSITLGRIGVGLIAHKISNRNLVRGGLMLAAIGSLLLLQQDLWQLYALGIVLIGGGFAPIYPSLMHETAARYPQEQATKVISYQVSFSYIATLLLTPLMGIVASATTLEIIPWIVVLELSALTLVVLRLDQVT